MNDSAAGEILEEGDPAKDPRAFRACLGQFGTGVAVAVRYGAEPLWLWGPFAAALSGAGGGILRDLLRTGYENPALRTSFYAEVCVLWGLALTIAILFLLRVDQPMSVRISVALTVLGAFATRIAVVVLKVRSPRF